MRDLARGPLLCALFALTLDCATLDALTLGTCGNGVLDPGEDCDGTHAGEKGKCGAPATSQACHYTCTAKTAAEDCPAGWGCSIAGTCAGPSGAFLPARDAQSAGVRTMLAGDFNGDGRQDILGLGGLGADNATKGRVHFAEADGELKEIVALPGLMTSPFVIDIDRNGVADIVFGYYDTSLGVSGVGLLKGQRERVFVPELFTSFIVPTSKIVAATLPAGGPQSAVGQGSSLIAVAESEDGLELQSLGSDQTNAYRHKLPIGPDALVGNRLYIGKMFQKPQSGCGEAVVAFREGTTLKAQIFSPCVLNGDTLSWNNGSPKEVSLANAGPAATVFVGDVNGDGFDDLVMARGVKGEDAIIWQSTGSGLAAPKPLAIPAATEKIPFSPIAAGDLNADGVPDLVYRFGVLLSAVDAPPPDGGPPPPSSVRFLFQSASRLWSTARLADLNNDGVPEVIAASDAEPDVDVLELRKTIVGNLLPSFTVSTRGPVTDLVTLDLDFDGLPDIVVLDAPSSTDERFVSVAYGKLTMPPEPARAIGRLSNLQQLLVSNIGLVVTRRLATANALPDLGVAVVFPSSERQPLAPLLFDESSALARQPRADGWRPRALVAAPFTATDTDDLVALGMSSPPARVEGDPARGIWIAKGTSDRRFSPPTEVLNLDQLPIIDSETNGVRFAMAIGDLDGDKRAEVVAITDEPVAGATARIFSVPAGGGEPKRKEIPIPNRRLPNGVRFDPRVDLMDIDGDKNLDLVVLLEEKVAKGGLKVDVFFGDGAGSFATTPVTVQLPARAPGSPPWEPSAYAQVTTVSANRDFTGTMRRDLFIITATNLFQATLAPDRSGFTTTDVTNLLEGGLTYGTGLVAGDFDGDGVEDLAIAVDGAIRILRQKPRGK
jgi:hypothetical protein